MGRFFEVWKQLTKRKRHGRPINPVTVESLLSAINRLDHDAWWVEINKLGFFVADNLHLLHCGTLVKIKHDLTLFNAKTKTWTCEHGISGITITGNPPCVGDE